MSVSQLSQYTCAIGDKAWYYTLALIFFIVTALQVILYLCLERSKVLHAFCYDLSNVFLGLVMGVQAAQNFHSHVGYLSMAN